MFTFVKMTNFLYLLNSVQSRTYLFTFLRLPPLPSAILMFRVQTHLQKECLAMSVPPRKVFVIQLLTLPKNEFVKSITTTLLPLEIITHNYLCSALSTSAVFCSAFLINARFIPSLFFRPSLECQRQQMFVGDLATGSRCLHFVCVYF